MYWVAAPSIRAQAQDGAPVTLQGLGTEPRQALAEDHMAYMCTVPGTGPGTCQELWVTAAIIIIIINLYFQLLKRKLKSSHVGILSHT